MRNSSLSCANSGHFEGDPGGQTSGEITCTAWMIAMDLLAISTAYGSARSAVVEKSVANRICRNATCNEVRSEFKLGGFERKEGAPESESPWVRSTRGHFI